MPKFTPYPLLSDRHKRRVDANMKHFISVAHQKNHQESKFRLVESDTDELSNLILHEENQVKTDNDKSNPVNPQINRLKINSLLEFTNFFTENSSELQSDNNCSIAESNCLNCSDVEDSNNLRNRLVNWAVTRDIELVDINSLLSILSEFHPEDNLPKDARTLLKTPRKTVVFEMRPGEYAHFSLKFSLLEYLDNQKPAVVNHIDLQVGIDGMPILMNCTKSFWPIMGRVLHSKDVF